MYIMYLRDEKRKGKGHGEKRACRGYPLTKVLLGPTQRLPLNDSPCQVNDLAMNSEKGSLSIKTWALDIASQGNSKLGKLPIERAFRITLEVK